MSISITNIMLNIYYYADPVIVYLYMHNAKNNNNINDLHARTCVSIKFIANHYCFMPIIYLVLST